MNTERTMQIIAMRENGMTYREIADHFGIYISSVVNSIRRTERKKASGIRGRRLEVESIANKHIREYFEAHPDESCTSFAWKVMGSQGYGKIQAFLHGCNSTFTVEQIRTICEIIGKPFEEIFGEGETE